MVSTGKYLLVHSAIYTFNLGEQTVVPVQGTDSAVLSAAWSRAWSDGDINH